MQVLVATLTLVWFALQGMQRFPAVSWTGDGQSCTHQELLRAILHGQPYISCDLTSPDATTLVRQYQSAVFNPIMRVHQVG
jgi:alpha-glucosidase (family GH31 glycosyl hydrolase)